jgi:uncharacterized phage protein (TIGR01671 family)
MREILFRGKAVGSLKWVEGFYFREAGNFIKELPSAVSTETHMVYEDTLGQYTGLTDKNGKKIFEGDIVNIEYDTIVKNAVIEYRGASFYGSTHADLWELDNYYDIEVVGNIHDNPELLKGGAE